MADEAQDWQQTTLARTKLDKILAERAGIVEEAKGLEERKKALDARVRGLLEKHHVQKVKCGNWMPMLVVSHRPRRLDATRLLELGVKQSIIEKAFVGGEEYQQFRIQGVKDGTGS